MTCLCHDCQLGSTQRDIERHRRVMRLADQNGYEIITKRNERGELWWFVPHQFVPIAGAMVVCVE